MAAVNCSATLGWRCDLGLVRGPDPRLRTRLRSAQPDIVIKFLTMTTNPDQVPRSARSHIPTPLSPRVQDRQSGWAWTPSHRPCILDVMLTAVVFDVDGVLVDSRAANARFFQNLLGAAGYDAPRSRDIQEYFHLSMYDAIAKLTRSDDPAEIEHIWTLGHDTSLYPVELLEYPVDLKNVLQQLEPHYRLGIATSRIRRGMRELLERGGIQRYFESIVTFDDYTHPKPHPEPLLLAAERLNVCPSAAVYVGDSTNDIIAAVAAGMKGIHLSETPSPQADIGIRTITELPDAVRQLAHSGAIR